MSLRTSQRLRSLAKYASVSVVSTAVGLSTLALLVGVGHWPAAWANVVATALGTVPSFELNRRWVWGGHGRPSFSRQVLPFLVLCGLEMVASTAAVSGAASWTRAQGWPHLWATTADLVANVMAYGILWVAQYLVLDRLLFSRYRSDARPGTQVLPGAVVSPQEGIQ